MVTGGMDAEVPTELMLRLRLNALPFDPRRYPDSTPILEAVSLVLVRCTLSEAAQGYPPLSDRRSPSVFKIPLGSVQGNRKHERLIQFRDGDGYGIGLARNEVKQLHSQTALAGPLGDRLG
jgi:hypothetical protein